jgi:hypothetical protein
MPDKRMDGFFKLWEDAQSVKDAEEELADAEARLRNPRAPGWLYAVGPAEQMRLWDWGVEDWGPPVLRVKIGVSKHELAPQGRRGRRLSELQCGSPVALGVYDEVRVPDMQKAEEEVHALLKHARLHGEWFDATDDAVHWWLQWLRCTGSPHKAPVRAEYLERARAVAEGRDRPHKDPFGRPSGPVRAADIMPSTAYEPRRASRGAEMA